jgi:hypothetical protein
VPYSARAAIRQQLFENTQFLGEAPPSSEERAPWIFSLINHQGSGREFPGYHLKGFG